MKTDDKIEVTSGTDKKRRSTFAILFYINRTKIRKDGKCQLLCKVSIDAVPEQIGTHGAVDPEIWNPETGRAAGRSRNAIEVNRIIDCLTKKIKDHYKQINDNLGFVTAELVKNAVLGIAQKPLTLLALFREHNAEFHKRVSVDRTKETYESYVRSYNHLQAFVQTKCEKQDVTLRSLNMEFYDSFEIYLNKDCGLMQKTVHEHLYRLKKMTKRAVNQGTLRCDPYGKQHPALPKRRSRHLSLDDLKKLLEQQIDMRPNMQRVRDWFIFSTFTGLAYADLKRLSENHISQAADGSWWIHIQRQKTETPSAIRLLDVPLKIIEKYRPERRSDKIFNIYSRTYIAQLVRKVGTAYGIDMTFHKARHNFGTHITLSQGIPIETVSRMMGHKSITTTQIYAKVTDTKVDEDMKLLKANTTDKKVNLYEDETITPKQRCCHTKSNIIQAINN